MAMYAAYPEWVERQLRDPHCDDTYSQPMFDLKPPEGELLSSDAARWTPEVGWYPAYWDHAQLHEAMAEVQ